MDRVTHGGTSSLADAVYVSYLNYKEKTDTINYLASGDGPRTKEVRL